MMKEVLGNGVKIQQW